MKQDTIKIGDYEITFETGEVAKQASGAVLVKCRDTVILVTVVADEIAKEDMSFFPLTVEYREKTAAAGRIPGGFIKRETRPQNHEILTSRLIDRSIRPLFPKSFRCETQVLATVYSFDSSTETAPLCIMGAAAALQISNIPWAGPVCGLKLVRKNGEFCATPSHPDSNDCDMDVMMSSSRDGLIMLEGITKEVSEEDLLSGIDFATASMEPFFALMDRWVSELEVEKRDYEEPQHPQEILGKVTELAKEKL